MVECLACGVSLMMIALLTCGSLASDETCADMEFEGLTQEVTVRVEENTYVNVTFYLNTSKCPEDRNSFQIRVRESRGLLSVIMCTIVVEKTTCRVTMSSERCQCLPDTEGWMRMFHLMSGTGLVSCTWSWTELTSSLSDKKTSINFDVFGDFNTEEETTVFQGDGADLYFTGLKGDETVRILVHSFVNLSFHLNTSDCAYSPEWFRLKVESTQDGFNVGICNILFQGGTCNIRDQSEHCRCLHTSSVLLHTRLTKLGRDVYIWSLSDSTRNQDQKKTQITFNVVIDSNGSNDVLTMTPAGETESRTEGINVNIIIVYTSGITAAVIIIPIAIVISVYVYRRRKARMSCQTADNERRQIPDISLHVPENRRPPTKDEDEYSEIAEDMTYRESSPVRVHENYEHPLQEEGEGQLNYSRLVYKSLRQNGNGHGKDSSDTNMGDLSPSIIAVKEQQTDKSVTCTADEYLEPVPSCKGTVT